MVFIVAQIAPYGNTMQMITMSLNMMEVEKWLIKV